MLSATRTGTGIFAHLPAAPTKDLPEKAAWQAKRLLTQAAGQLGFAAQFGSPLQKATFLAAVRSLEQLSQDLVQLARPPRRIRRPACSPEWRQAFAVLLRERREACGLSRQQLARKSKLALTTIRNMETLRGCPDRKTVEQLLSVPELGLAEALGFPQPGVASERAVY